VDFDQVAAERLAQAKRAGELERQANALDEMILDITLTIAQAKAERDRQRQSMLWGTGVNIAELREQLERSKQKRTKLAPAIQVEQPREVRVATPPIRTTSAVRQRRDDDFEP
jgi:hypothetical protein